MVAAGDTAPRERVGFAEAPADRPPFRRGPRAALAWMSGAAAVVALVARDWGTEGSTGDERRTLDYVMDGPEWVGPTLLAAAAAFLLAALLLWAARGTVGAFVGVALLACAATATVTAIWVRAGSGTAPRAELRAATDLPNEDDLRSALGAPAGHGTLSGRGGPATCLVYYQAESRDDSIRTQHFFCFRDGRLVETEEF